VGAKHTDVLVQRESSRASLLDLYRQLATERRKAIEAGREIESIKQLIDRERSRFTELTREAVQLLHADASGVLGSGVALDDMLDDVPAPVPDAPATDAV
jgi:hypothetical protein